MWHAYISIYISLSTSSYTHITQHGGTLRSFAKSNKSSRERKLLYDLTYMLKSKKETNKQKNTTKVY